jgi:hypothetical protein
MVLLILIESIIPLESFLWSYKIFKLLSNIQMIIFKIMESFYLYSVNYYFT